MKRSFVVFSLPSCLWSVLNRNCSKSGRM
jgi:hypothetical protein